MTTIHHHNIGLIISYGCLLYTKLLACTHAGCLPQALRVPAPLAFVALACLANCPAQSIHVSPISYAFLFCGLRQLILSLKLLLPLPLPHGPCCCPCRCRCRSTFEAVQTTAWLLDEVGYNHIHTVAPLFVSMLCRRL